MVILTVNDKTGEVKEVSLASPFRCLTDLKEYKDGEDYKEGTSCTSLEGYEPLEDIVARCTRTMVTQNGMRYAVLDKDALKAEAVGTPIYEAGSASTLDEAFATLDPTSSQGFDLADASEITEALREKAQATDNLSTERANESPQKATVSDGTVGKSDEAVKPSETNPDFPENSQEIASSTIPSLDANSAR